MHPLRLMRNSEIRTSGGRELETSNIQIGIHSFKRTNILLFYIHWVVQDVSGENEYLDRWISNEI